MEIHVDKNSVIDLAKCPHILIGGSTGSGKSYLMKNMLCDVLQSGEAKVMVLDPKSVDYKFLVNGRSLDSIGRSRTLYVDGYGYGDVIGYSGNCDMRTIRHRMSRGEVVEISETEYYKDRWNSDGNWLGDRDDIDSMNALDELKLLVKEMYRRYSYMKKYGYVDWSEVMEESESSELWNILEEEELQGRRPFGNKRIVLFVDELADLIYWDREKSKEVLVGYEVDEVLSGLEVMLGKYEELDSKVWKSLRGNIEGCLVKISILGRAAGIHLVLGTQRPDAQVLSGQLRANLPCRICLRVSNSMERRIILGMSGYGVEREMIYESKYYGLVRDLR